MKLLAKRAFRVGLPLVGLIGIGLVAYSFHNLNSVTLSSSYFLYFSILRTVIPFLVVLVILPSLFGYSSPIK
jgi:hypothetical protein